MSERTVGPAELAEALDVSERHVYRLHGLGMPKDGRGSYPLVRCVRWYRTHVLDPSENGDAPELGEARLRKAKTRALEAERKLARRQGEVVSAEAWDAVEQEARAWIREEVAAVAPDWAEKLEGVESAREAEARLRGHVRELMAVLQQGPPAIHVQKEEAA